MHLRRSRFTKESVQFEVCTCHGGGEVDRKVSTIGFFTFAFALDPPEKERAKVVQGFFFHLTQSILKTPPQKKNQIDLVLLVKRNMKEKKTHKKRRKMTNVTK
jgi:hypothetical protein